MSRMPFAEADYANKKAQSPTGNFPGTDKNAHSRAKDRTETGQALVFCYFLR